MKHLSRTALLLGPLILSGCSTLIGPNAAHYETSINEADAASSNWTKFSSIEEAQRRLATVSDRANGKAMNIIRASNSNDDLIVASLLAAAVAGATGSVEGVRWGTGLAALLGIAPNRYNVEAQRQNLLKVSDTFTCIGAATDGLTSVRLSTMILPNDKIDAAALNRTRLFAVPMVSIAAKDVEKSFVKAMAEIKLVQPDYKAFEKAVAERAQSSAANASAIQSLVSRAGFAKDKGSKGAGAGNPADTKKAMDETQRYIDALKEMQSRLPKELKSETDTLKAERESLKSKLKAENEKLTALKQQFWEQIDTLLTTNEDFETQIVLIDKISSLESSLTACKAMISS